MAWQAPWEDEYRRIDALRQQLAAEGTCLGWGECRISFWRLQDKVYCCRSHTQIDYCCPAAEWDAYSAKFHRPLRTEPIPYSD